MTDSHSANAIVDALLSVRETDAPRTRPMPLEPLGFGRFLADHVLRVDYAPMEGWHEWRIEPYGAMPFEPAAGVLHYAQAIFEGLKAFRGADGVVRVFRLADHCRRFATSAVGLAMPPVDPEALADGILQLIKLDAGWVPAARGTALYIRPFMFANEAFIGVRAAERFACLVITSPVAPYYGGGTTSGTLKATRLWVEDQAVRAAPGGIGAIKAAANYAASIRAAVEAKKKGFDQVLWLDALSHTEIEEAGTMNVFVRIGDEVMTPPLGGTILAGITRDSSLALLRDWGISVTERSISVAEMRAAHARGELNEVFGTGTAAVISPVGVLGFRDTAITVGDGTPGPIARRLYDAITAIQYGEASDPHKWTTKV